MKTKLFFLILLFVIPFGCKEEKQIEVIPDYDKIYIPYDQVDEAPQLVEGSDMALHDTLFKTFFKLYPSFDTMKNKPTMEYKFMINELGDIDKIFIGNNNDKSLNLIVLRTIKNWKYKPAVKNGKITKSQSPMIIWLEKGNQINEKEFFVAVEEMPEPIGGLKSIQEKIIYPEIAKRAGIEGKVYVLAFIDEKGNVANAKIIKGIGGGCEETALDAVKQTKFTPGKQRGKPVKVQVSIPIVFKLQ
jgi:TonB family protein